MTNSHPYMTHRGAQAMAVSIIFTGLATSFVLARLYTRIWIMKRIEANDWMVLVALVPLPIYAPTSSPRLTKKSGKLLHLHGPLYPRIPKRHGHAHSSNPTLNPNNPNESLLGHNPLLQCGCSHRKSHHSNAIPPRLPHPAHATHLLDHDRASRHIWDLVRAERVSELHSRGEVLGSED